MSKEPKMGRCPASLSKRVVRGGRGVGRRRRVSCHGQVVLVNTKLNGKHMRDGTWSSGWAEFEDLLTRCSALQLWANNGCVQPDSAFVVPFVVFIVRPAQSTGGWWEASVPLFSSRRPSGGREDEEVAVIGAASSTKGMLSNIYTASTNDGKKLRGNILVTRILETG